MKQITRILRNTGTTCLCQAVVLGNRLLHLLICVLAKMLIRYYHYPTLKRGEGSFVALLGNEKTCHLKNAP